MTNEQPALTIKFAVDKLADINAALQEHARRFCGTELKGYDWQALQRLIVARQNTLAWLAAQDVYLDIGQNVWKAPRVAG